jgi:two-component system, NarL family, response regulator DegU
MGLFMIKVVIADDHPLIRLGIRKMFEGERDIRVVGEASNGQEAIAVVEQHNPDVLLLDLHMPIMDGVQVLEHLNKHGLQVRVLILSAFYDPLYTSEIFNRGAWAYFLKEEAPLCIVDAVRQAARGDGKGTRPKPTPS